MGYLAITLVVFASGTAIASGAEHSQTTAGGQIIELYPNPTTPQNHGEYVVVKIDQPGVWTLTDGHSTAKIPAGTTGTVALSRHPDKTATHTNETIVDIESYLRLAVNGDTLTLKQDGEVVDSVSYRQAPESHRWRHETDPHWQPDGFDPRKPKTVEAKPTEAFVLPDASDAPLDALDGADQRLYLAAYTLESERVVAELIAAHTRGAAVVVLVEGGPVGGMSTTQADRLDELTDAGVDVQVMTGDQTRYRYHHPKYAVVDDRAVILTENWKPSGTGGKENRGWGLTVDSPQTADELAAIFDHDSGWADTDDWTAARERIDTYDQTTATGSFRQHHPPETTTADTLTILAAPDNAADELVDRIDATDDRLLIVQPRIADSDFRLLRAAIRAADRGVSVRILLGSQWYDESDNEALATELRERAAQSDSPLEVRLADADNRFGKIHAKGIVADDTAVVGSLNWNNNSVENNREIAVAVEDAAIADYYADVFDGDWDGDSDEEQGLPVGIIVLSIGVAGGAVILLHRRLSFADDGTV